MTQFFLYLMHVVFYIPLSPLDSLTSSSYFLQGIMQTSLPSALASSVGSPNLGEHFGEPNLGEDFREPNLGEVLWTLKSPPESGGVPERRGGMLGGENASYIEL